MAKRLLSGVAFLVIFGALSRSANAVPIPTLFNTGVSSGGTLLVGGNGVTDPHWSVISGPGISSPVSAVTFFDAAYTPDGPNSRFISNSSTGAPGNGNFVFRTTFNLTGFDTLQTSINGMCEVDNLALSVLLNGATVLTQGNICSSYQNFHAFSISSGFVSGINTLDFTINDTGPPMAFRAELTGNTVATGVPEPSTILIAGLGLLLLGYRWRKIRS